MKQRRTFEERMRKVESTMSYRRGEATARSLVRVVRATPEYARMRREACCTTTTAADAQRLTAEARDLIVQRAMELGEHSAASALANN